MSPSCDFTIGNHVMDKCSQILICSCANDRYCQSNVFDHYCNNMDIKFISSFKCLDFLLSKINLNVQKDNKKCKTQTIH